MDEKDVVTHAYWSDNERFADIMNAGLFHGKTILRGEDLSSEERYTGGLFGRLRKRKAVYKYRDVIKKAAFGSNFVLLGIENQSKIDYAMPVRVMGYDFLNYDEQLRKIKKVHRRKKDLRDAEFLSGFSKEDKLNPIFTQILYYGLEPWDGPENLSSLLDWSSVPQELRDKVADYPAHVLDVRRFEESETLKTDAKFVFGFLKRQNDGKALKAYIDENREYFSSLYEDAYDLISILTNSKELLNAKNECENSEGGIDMCEAMKQWKEEAIAEAEEAFASLTEKLLEAGKTDELLRATKDKGFREELYKKYKIKKD